MKFFTLVLIALVGSVYFVGYRSSVSDCPPTGYCPWDDLDDDGDIDIFDIVEIAGRYGTTGEPLLGRAAIEYDSSWLNITDKCGQYFNVVHNFNSTEIMVDLSGKTAEDGGIHQRNLGGTGFIPGWTRTYGGAITDYGYSVVQTADGGYAVAGYTLSIAEGRDFWLVKTDALGNHLWNQTYGGTGDDEAQSIIQTDDGGYAVAGYTYSFGAGNTDFWLIKTDALGNHLWNQTYGGTGHDTDTRSVVQTSDGGYVIAGNTASFGAGGHDFWLVRISTESGLAWTDSTADTITLYRGATDSYWNYVRVRIWKIKETP